MRAPLDIIRPEKNPFQEMYAREVSGKKRGSFFAGVARFVLLVIVGCVSGVLGIVVQGYIYFNETVPSIEKLSHYSPPVVSRIYGSRGEIIAEFAEERRFVLPIEEIPLTLQQAFVSAEDKNFWTHQGVDKEAIIRAIIDNLTHGGIRRGASTITQQVAKTFLLSSVQKFTRKIKEAILSLRIERSFSKQYILYLYLNQIYLGSKAYGVEAAAQTYFGKHVSELTLAECAMLAGLPKAPSKYSPYVNLEEALKRRAYVLRRMLEDSQNPPPDSPYRYAPVTQEQYEQAMQEEPRLVSKKSPHLGIAPDFVEHVRQIITKKYGKDALKREGLHVYTTVDLELTKAGQEAIDAGLRELDKRQGYMGPLRTLNPQGINAFLEEKSRAMTAPLKFGQIVEGVITHIDNENISVRLGTYKDGDIQREYIGQIKIDPNPKWWVRKPYIRPEKRTRNFSQGDLPFLVGDVIYVQIVDPNIKRRELYMKKYGRNDPDMQNYKEYTEDMMPYFLLEPEQQPLVQAALMMRENKTGYVRVLLGGSTASDSKYNRATQARRQAGSSFKPVIYAAALNKGFTCADIIIDSPLALTVPGTGEVWRPKNHGGGFQGPMTFREAIVKSKNIPTIKILQQIGIDHAKGYARKLGYTSPLVDNLTLALGSAGVSLEEQVNAFAVFPNKGYYIPSVYITKVVDRHGKVLEEHHPPMLMDDPSDPENPRIQRIAHEVFRSGNSGEFPDIGAHPIRRTIDEATAYIMTTLLQDVVQEGTATILKKIVGRPDIGGKTGTTNDCIDAWFIGFSPDLTCGVWVGFDEEVSIGDGETGGKAAAPIWGLFMKYALRNKPLKEFQRPPSVEVRRVDRRTGLLTSAGDGHTEVFKVGSGAAKMESKGMKGVRWDNSGEDLDQF